MKIIKNLTNVLGLVPVANGKGGSGMKARTIAFFSVGVAAVMTALATPPSAIVSATVVARASFAEPVDLKFKIEGERGQEVIDAPELQDTVIQQIIIGPGGSTGWHSHPGPVVVLVTAGELTLYSAEDPTCTPRTYSAGQAFVESGQGHVNLARNLGNQNVELWATYFDVPAGGPIRLDAADPGNCN